MGRYLHALLLIFGLVVLTMAMTKKEAKEALESFGSNCDPPPSDADYDELISNTEKASQSSQCLRYCLMKQGSMFDSDGKLDVEQMKAYTGMMFEGKEETGGKMAEVCNTEVKADNNCTLAHLYGMCLLKQMKANDLEMEKLE